MKKQGFSLVELSIVLVILGLLTGGILAGQSLIRAAHMRIYYTSIDQLRTATIAFRDKYFAVPGDMADATKFWGTLAGNGSNATCQDTEATGLPTCNGDGNSYVNDSSLSGVLYDERFRFWQHLANAGLIEGKYTGKTDGASGTYSLTPGKNTFTLRDGNTYDVLTAVGTSLPTGAAGSFPFVGSLRDKVSFMQMRGPGNNNRLLTPTETWNIDNKVDDGRPSRGNITAPMSSFTNSPGCTTNDDAATAAYSLSSNDKICTFRASLF